MRLVIAAVGRLKSGPEADLIADYAARIKAGGKALGITDFSISEVEAPKGLEGVQRQSREGELLAAALPDSGWRIALDERGKELGSAEFAKLSETKRDQGSPAISFIIGGADGLVPAIRESANSTLAFGKATWPHMLVRAMLCEQIYRAMTILAGHPYHRA